MNRRCLLSEVRSTTFGIQHSLPKSLGYSANLAQVSEEDDKDASAIGDYAKDKSLRSGFSLSLKFDGLALFMDLMGFRHPAAVIKSGHI